ncbi:immunogenic protein MPB64/MPT64 [Mycobacterium lentiflavum]|uniref:Immunogenic protein MPB64/MPT64 n=1 Tax=Mycobacterium lentiflavum TaxID=141349 RepID=A0A0E4GWK6_MYCLN|nr:esterase [Mycobacterium lentiflavum]MEE3062822.1 esterase [Actinomycetota bacterium]ULP43920.1 RsiV family protein [Mycobacterium lentiflavum]CQD09981.1 immunogenic protein MPB64/MPT64 [Mycobacterium lentiflavum]
MRYLIAAAVLVTTVLLGWPAAADPPSCASVGGTVGDGQMCHIHATSPTYTLNMTFPADYPDPQPLIDYITQNRDGFLSVAQTSGPRDQPYQLEMTTEQHFAGQPPHNTRSVVLKFFQDVGGSHTSTWYKAFNYNVGTKQPITFDNLFAPNTSALETIFPLVKADLERQNALGAAVLPSSGRDPSHYQNFAITDDQLIFYFAPGEMLPAFAGACQAQVPRNAIPPLAV